jgi:hypothetical protein
MARKAAAPKPPTFVPTTFVASALATLASAVQSGVDRFGFPVVEHLLALVAADKDTADSVFSGWRADVLRAIVPGSAADTSVRDLCKASSTAAWANVTMSHARKIHAHAATDAAFRSDLIACLLATREGKASPFSFTAMLGRVPGKERKDATAAELRDRMILAIEAASKADAAATLVALQTLVKRLAAQVKTAA